MPEWYSLAVAAPASVEPLAGWIPSETVRTIVHRRSDREPGLLRELAAARVGHQSHVLVDLGDTPMVSAAVLAALGRLGICLRDRGGELTVRSSHSGFVRLLELTLLSLSFEVEQTATGRASHA